MKSRFTINRKPAFAVFGRFAFKSVLTTLLITGTVFYQTATAEAIKPASDVAASLESLAGLYEQRIASLELEIRTETERRTTVLEQLDSLMTEISSLEKETNHVADNAPQLSESVDQINREIASVEHNIGLNNRYLEQIRNAREQQPGLSVWQAALGKPEIKARHKLLATQNYLIYTAQQKQVQLQNERVKLNDRYQSIVEYNRGINDSIGELQSTTRDMAAQRATLELQLTEISSEIVARQDRISTLSERAETIASEPLELHFIKMKSKLQDPIEGELIREFSEPKAKGLLKWQGILVEAPLGLPFTAVSDGLVVFADQLQGLGNVAIVDHGHGYMTLYGMAELLLVQQDQLVLSGDPIGTVGESVAANTSALYFEVRHNADAVDPQDWLQMHLITQKQKL